MNMSNNSLKVKFVPIRSISDRVSVTFIPITGIKKITINTHGKYTIEILYENCSYLSLRIDFGEEIHQYWYNLMINEFGIDKELLPKIYEENYKNDIPTSPKQIDKVLPIAKPVDY